MHNIRILTFYSSKDNIMDFIRVFDIHVQILRLVILIFSFVNSQKDSIVLFVLTQLQKNTIKLITNSYKICH